MSIDNYVNGAKVIMEAKGTAFYIPTVEKRFFDLYRKKHFNELMHIANDRKLLTEWYDKRDKTFEKYCKFNYKSRKPRLDARLNDEGHIQFFYPHNNQ